MHSQFAKHVSIIYRVSGHLVELGNTSWQLKNIVSTSIVKEVGKLKEERPILIDKKPKAEYQYAGMAICIFFAWMYGLSVDKPILAGVSMSLLAIGFWLLLARYSLKNRLYVWEDKFNKVLRDANAWDEIKNNPPILHKLVFETASGSMAAFHSFELKCVSDFKDIINRAVSNTEWSGADGLLNVVDLEGNDIDAFTSRYYMKCLKVHPSA